VILLFIIAVASRFGFYCLLTDASFPQKNHHFFILAPWPGWTAKIG